MPVFLTFYKILQRTPIFQLFHRGLYLFTLLFLYQIIEPDRLKDSLPVDLPSSGWMFTITHIFYEYPNIVIYHAFLGLSIILSLLGLFFYYRTIFTDLFVWLIYINFIHFHPEGLHGGHYALGNFLFLSSFFSKKLNNIGIVWNACRLQLALIYVLSAYFKWKDAFWNSGNAFTEIFYSDWFNPCFIHFNSFWSIIFSYLVLLFQVTFPLAFFMGKFKKLYVWFGVLFHVFIGVFMALPSFAAIMIWMYLLFFKSDYLMGNKP